MAEIDVSALLAFIEERLTEDEQVARAADQEAWVVVVVDATFGTAQIECGNEGWLVSSHYEDAEFRLGDADHIARHNPARVLREVEAKRRLLARHHRTALAVDPYDNAHLTREECDADGDDWPCRDVRSLASIWANHPDFHAEWLIEENTDG